MLSMPPCGVGYLSDQSVSAVPAESPLNSLCTPVPSLVGSYKELLDSMWALLCIITTFFSTNQKHSPVLATGEKIDSWQNEKSSTERAHKLKKGYFWCSSRVDGGIESLYISCKDTGTKHWIDKISWISSDEYKINSTARRVIYQEI